MRPWTVIDREPAPDDDAMMSLVKRGSEYVVLVDDRELMGTRHHASEDALADLACDRLARLDDARILVGGLGMGFTLAAALRRVGEAGHVTVAEISPAVVRWNREVVGHIARSPLKDPRTEVFLGDVCDLVEGPQRWSAILLDVDNGPAALSRPTNGWLYTPHGLKTAKRALLPGGVLGIWSHTNDPGLQRHLRKTGFDIDVVRLREPTRPTKDGLGTHVLWFARPRSEPAR